MAARFKPGDVLELAEGNTLIDQGWKKNMLIKIDEIDDRCYIYTYLVDCDDFFHAGMRDRWIFSIIDANFKISKTGYILYGRKEV